MIVPCSSGSGLELDGCREKLALMNAVDDVGDVGQ